MCLQLFHAVFWSFQLHECSLVTAGAISAPDPGPPQNVNPFAQDKRQEVRSDKAAFLPQRYNDRFWGFLTGLMTIALASSASAMPGVPGPAWFEGVFERVGRSGGETTLLLNDRMQVVAQDQQLAFRTCDGRPMALMSFNPTFETVNLLVGQNAEGAPMECLFNTDGDVRPLLTCQAADGAAFTLFSLTTGTDGCGG